MIATDEHPTEKESRSPRELKSEGPLIEKDEQGQAVERSRSLQKQALENWHRLKEKVGKIIHRK
jgi:hypothetical protein